LRWLTGCLKGLAGLLEPSQRRLYSFDDSDMLKRGVDRQAGRHAGMRSAPCFPAFLKRGMEAHHGQATVSKTRKLAAILVADIVGYSRLAGGDEDRILARLRTLRSDLIDPILAVHHGRVVKRTGEGRQVANRRFPLSMTTETGPQICVE
jgi:class 3 adenylate cyclase